MHIAPLAEERVALLGPWYANEDAERRDEIVAAVRPLMPAALSAALTLGFEDRRQAALAATDTLAQYGDDLQYGSGSGIDALATVIAALAAQPGGVDLVGYHWCREHTLCEAVDAG
ncbi:hypothetical protein [Nocardiopsis synnemataformans]|uniref:hypothetical protein n=1 Tax=Nocardiopsis synnemataformans TaxID=61305 RepID=UPI003EB9BC25